MGERGGQGVKRGAGGKTGVGGEKGGGVGWGRFRLKSSEGWGVRFRV